MSDRGYRGTSGKEWMRPLGPQLVVHVTPIVEGHRYGGASVTGAATIFADGVQEFFDTSVSSNALWSAVDADRPVSYFVTHRTFGALLTDSQDHDVQWQVRNEPEIDDAIRLFCDVVDGPLSEWLRTRGTTADIVRHEISRTIVSPFTGRTQAVMALQQGRPDLAVSLMEKLAANPRARPDDLRRLSAFQDILVRNFPNYRPVPIPEPPRNPE